MENEIDYHRMASIEHSKEPLHDCCIQWRDNAGCCSWPCEVEAARRQRDTLAADCQFKDATIVALESKIANYKNGLRYLELEEARDALAATLVEVIDILPDEGINKVAIERAQTALEKWGLPDKRF